MGNACTSPQNTRETRGMKQYWSSTAKVIHEDGKVQQFKTSIEASYILSQNPNYFLCNSEHMHVDSHAPQVPMDQKLQLGQIYFLIRLSKSNAPLSLHDLCSLAVKASATLQHTAAAGTNNVTYIHKSYRCCTMTGLQVTGISSQARGAERNDQFDD